jgi:Prenyltransferase and squalene oxidase repeat
MARLAATILQGLRHAPDLWLAARQQGAAQDDELHLRLAAGWLLAAQRAGGGGFAHSYHLLHGWQPAYPETTGYIIPSLHRLHLRWQSADLLVAVQKAAAWLVSIQSSDGSFCDLAGQPQVFDTGQVLMGFNYLATQSPGMVAPDAHLRAARWLAQVQERDGSFVSFSYNNRPHAYYSRVGSALISAGKNLHDPLIETAGIRNLEWTVAQQAANGFFRYASFNDAPAFLHTMVYILEGLLDGFSETGEKSYFDAARKFAESLLQAARRDGILRSQYQDDYSVANGETCMTGLAQWAGICLRMSKLLGDASWSEQAELTINYLKSRQIRCGNERLNGGLTGSVPLTGRYMRAAIPNWGVKFFIDALLERAQPPRSRRDGES